jgi:transposase
VVHVAAVIDTAETALATLSFSTTRAGYRALTRWMRSFGDIAGIGIEGTGGYGAGICRHLTDSGTEVLEVDRPDRSDRRRKGKDDDLDAISAARAALRGQRTSTPIQRAVPERRAVAQFTGIATGPLMGTV